MSAGLRWPSEVFIKRVSPSALAFVGDGVWAVSGDEPATRPWQLTHTSSSR